MSIVYSFKTFKNQQLRTIGLGCLVSGESISLSEWGADQALTIHKLFGEQELKTKATARGKVFFITVNNEKQLIENNCFQIKNNNAKEVYCGNSTAASSAVLSIYFNGLSKLSHHFVCEGTTIKINSEMKKKGRKINVAQKWEVDSKRINIEKVQINEHSGYKLEFMNDYIFLVGPIKKEENIVQKIISDSSLDKKVCIIYPESKHTKVKFYNCNGLHGAAPLTGLASLSFLIEHIDQLRGYFKEKKVVTPSSLETLPRLEFCNKNVMVNLTDVDVSIKKLWAK